jgi:hypothetical protein
MLVLDEQLLGRNLEVALARWYRGSVLFITELRRDTIIKDEAVPTILGQQRSPTFVTINDADFWRSVAIDRRFCVICFPLPDSQAELIPGLLRSVLHHQLFRTKAQRMGKVLRVTQSAISYYTYRDRQIHIVSS